MVVNLSMIPKILLSAGFVLVSLEGYRFISSMSCVRQSRHVMEKSNSLSSSDMMVNNYKDWRRLSFTQNDFLQSTTNIKTKFDTLMNRSRARRRAQLSLHDRCSNFVATDCRTYFTVFACCCHSCGCINVKVYFCSFIISCLAENIIFRESFAAIRFNIFHVP